MRGRPVLGLLQLSSRVQASGARGHSKPVLFASGVGTIGFLTLLGMQQMVWTPYFMACLPLAAAHVFIQAVRGEVLSVRHTAQPPRPLPKAPSHPRLSPADRKRYEDT